MGLFSNIRSAASTAADYAVGTWQVSRALQADNRAYAQLCKDADTEAARRNDGTTQYQVLEEARARSRLTGEPVQVRQAATDTEPGAAPMAASLPPGTPHADPSLAAKGWQSNGRVYVRATPQIDREAI